MSKIVRCDQCQYEWDKSNPKFGCNIFEKKFKKWQTLFENGFEYDLCSFECVSKWLATKAPDAEGGHGGS